VTDEVAFITDRLWGPPSAPCRSVPRLSCLSCCEGPYPGCELRTCHTVCVLAHRHVHPGGCQHMSKGLDNASDGAYHNYSCTQTFSPPGAICTSMYVCMCVCMHSNRTFGQSPSQEADSTSVGQQLRCSGRSKRSLPCSQEPANSLYPEPDVAHLRLGLLCVLFPADIRMFTVRC
jgi:hypothetical protein